jgi:predicted RNase H-like nuclease
VRVVGIDGCPGGWFGLVLGDGTAAAAAPTVAEIISAVGPVEVVAIDIPSGRPSGGPRAADVAARARLGARRSTVFLTPVREALEAPTLAEAIAVSRARTGVGVSAQAYHLRSRVLEVDEWARRAGVEVREGHPEVSFATMAGAPLSTSKKTWAGVNERLALLSAHGVEIPADLGSAGRTAGPDDVVDAAAMAWTALRIGTGDAISLPSPPEHLDGWPTAIWA